MSPRNIVQQAQRAGLDAIAVCDHNSTHQLEEMQRLCNKEGMHLFLGVEITTREEVHLVGLFPTLEACRKIQEVIDQCIVKLNYNPEKMGDQIWVDGAEQIAGEISWYLNAPLSLSIEEVVALIHKHEGLAIAAHIDRPSYSISSQLGFVPKGLPLDGIEVSDMSKLQRLFLLQPELSQRAQYSASDAHFPEDIGRAYCKLNAEALTFEELRKALHQEDGRSIAACK